MISTCQHCQSVLSAVTWTCVRGKFCPGERISSGSAPQIQDLSGCADEHEAIAPSSGHGTASDQRTPRAATNALCGDS